jgi:hypothetical protein
VHDGDHYVLRRALGEDHGVGEAMKTATPHVRVGKGLSVGRAHAGPGSERVERASQLGEELDSEAGLLFVVPRGRRVDLR